MPQFLDSITMYIFTENQYVDNAKWKKIYMYLINSLWKNFSKCVKLVQNLTHFEKKFSKCVELVPNLTHFEKNFQSALSWSQNITHFEKIFQSA